MVFIVSCSGYKNDIKDETNRILMEFKSGDFSTVSDFESYINSLDEESKKTLVETFTNAEEWELKVGRKTADYVPVTVNISSNKKDSSFILYFIESNNGWIVKTEITTTTTIDVIPYLGKKEK